MNEFDDIEFSEEALEEFSDGVDWDGFEKFKQAIEAQNEVFGYEV